MNLLLMFLTVLFTTVLLELALRLTYFKGSLCQLEFPSNYFKLDKDSGFDITDNFSSQEFKSSSVNHEIWSNELGCFDLPYSGKDKFILLVGDSFTWGFTPFKYKWGNKIEDLTGTRVLKCGVGGYGTRQEYYKIKKIISLVKKRPELIIVGYFCNDIEDDYLFPRYTCINGNLVEKNKFKNIFTGEKIVYSDDELKQQLDNYKKYFCTFDNTFGLIKAWLRKNSIIYHIIKDSAIIRRPLSKINKLGICRFESSPDTYGWFERGLSQHLNNIRMIKELSDQIGSKLIFVIIPENYQVYESMKQAAIENRPQYGLIVNRIISYMDSQGIAYYDLKPGFKEFIEEAAKRGRKAKNSLYWRYDSHWNIKGNQLAGLLISKYLIENKIIKVDNEKEKLSEICREINNLESGS